MKNLLKFRTIFFIWLGWALVMAGYQVFVRARIEPVRPDYAVSWTPGETEADSQQGKPYLLEPFGNAFVSWDSEYYLSIAVGGYDDPAMRAIPAYYTWSNPQVALQSERPDWISMNYAFFPFYPLMIRLLAYPLALFGMNPIATATLAGVLVSMLGAFGAMLALYSMAKDALGEEGGLRAAFYLLVFPAAMFLAVIYTEGLFLGLSFGALALARRRKWIWAGLLAACATLTRAAGGLLLLPLVLFWLQDGGLKRLVGRVWWKEALGLLALAGPLWAYLGFQFTLGENFHIVESMFFSRGLLLFEQSWTAWKTAWDGLFHGPDPMRAYYLVEFGALFFAVFACLWGARKEPVLALYGLVSIFFSLTSGAAQGMHRYVMAAPLLFLVPARWGRNEAFDKAWTLGSILLMGIFFTMFAFDFWAG